MIYFGMKNILIEFIYNLILISSMIDDSILIINLMNER